MKKRKAQLLADGKPVTPMVTMEFSFGLRQNGLKEWHGVFSCDRPLPSLQIEPYDLKLKTGGSGKVFITQLTTYTTPKMKGRSEVMFMGTGRPPAELIP